jgi:hypothetical protein
MHLSFVIEGCFGTARCARETMLETIKRRSPVVHMDMGMGMGMGRSVPLQRGGERMGTSDATRVC